MENKANDRCYLCKFAIFDSDGSGNVWLHDCKKFDDVNKSDNECPKFELTHPGEQLIYKEY